MRLEVNMRARKDSSVARRIGWLLAGLLVLNFVAAGCGPAAGPAPTAAPPAATSAPPTVAVPAAASPAAVTSPVASPSPAVAAAPSPSPSPSPSPAALAPPARRLNVVAATTQIQDFVRNVGGDRVTVLGILPPDADAHDYQPTADDARKFTQADVIFHNGVGLEPWLEDLAKNARPGVPIVNLAQAANLTILAGEHEEDEEEPEHDKGDPHVWFDPTNVQKMVGVIRDALARVEAPGAAAYQANAAAYSRQLDALDAQIKQEIAAIPPAQRKLVTNHEAFGYYAERYGLEVVGAVIPSTSTEAQASAAQLQQLIRDIRDQNVKAIFTERSANPRLEEQIAQQAGVRIVSTLYGDSLGPPGSDGVTWSPRASTGCCGPPVPTTCTWTRGTSAGSSSRAASRPSWRRPGPPGWTRPPT
jgi:ABC-type Zn uptake system ZnuABC Zn-binding protein ZnuA